jgi:hypothetical protein
MMTSVYGAMISSVIKLFGLVNVYSSYLLI